MPLSPERQARIQSAIDWQQRRIAREMGYMPKNRNNDAIADATKNINGLRLLLHNGMTGFNG